MSTTQPRKKRKSRIRTNDRVEVVDIRQLLPPESLPCYNSVVIEHCLWKIPDLSEHFLYANDDMFFHKPLTPSFFFTSGGHPVVRLQRAFMGKWVNQVKHRLSIPTNIYRKTIHRAALLIEEKFGRYYSGTPHHNIDAYLKSDYRRVSEVDFKEEISATLTHHVRTEEDIQRIIYLYYALAINRGELRYVGRNESCRIRLHKPDFSYFFNKREVLKRDHDKWFHPPYGKKSRLTRLLKPYGKFVTLITPHNAQPYLKSTFKEVWEYAGDRLTAVSENRFRSPDDYTQELFRTWQICRSQFNPYNTYQDTKMFPLLLRSKQAIKALYDQSYKLVCLNDNQHIRDYERVMTEIEQAFETILPEKSTFEI